MTQDIAFYTDESKGAPKSVRDDVDQKRLSLVQIIDIFETIFETYFLKFSLTYYYFFSGELSNYIFQCLFEVSPLKKINPGLFLCNFRIFEVCSKSSTESESSLRQSIIFLF